MNVSVLQVYQREIECIVPVLGTVIGAATVISNVSKTIYDVAKGVFFGVHLLYQRVQNQPLQAWEKINQIKKDLFRHLTFIAIGVIRMIPVLGGLARGLYLDYKFNQQYQLIRQALDRKDYGEAKRLLEIAISEGNVYVLYTLGQLYHLGWGIVPDYEKAKYYYGLSIACKQKTAFFNLALLYERGLATPQDYSQAKYYYEKAAEEGDENALERLGHFYEFGLGIPKDYVKAKEYYEQAIAKGSSKALCNLGLLYERGLGVSQDYGKARWYYEQASEKKVGLASYLLGINYHFGIETPKDFIKAKEYYEKAVEQGVVEALFNLGQLHDMHQNLTSRDYRRMLDKLQNKFDHLLDFSQHITKAKNEVDYENAKQSFKEEITLKKADKSNHNPLLNDAKAMKYYEQAAAKGNPRALNRLGEIFRFGQLGMTQNQKLAIQYFEQAVTKGNADACLHLHLIYEVGELEDVAKAQYYENLYDQLEKDF
jgi:uncharacterized protein